MILEARRDVKYRYICEKCSVTTEWFTSAIYIHERCAVKSESRFKLNFEYDPIWVDKQKGNALQKLEEFTTVLENVLNDPTGEYNFPGEHLLADSYNKTFSAGGACPNCNGRQSWYPMDTMHLSVLKYIKVYVLSLLFFGNFAGLLFVIVFISTYSASPLLIPAFQLSLLVVGSCIGLLRAAYLIQKRKFVRKIPIVRHIPEVIWGEPEVYVLNKISE